LQLGFCVDSNLKYFCTFMEYINYSLKFRYGQADICIEVCFV